MQQCSHAECLRTNQTVSPACRYAASSLGWRPYALNWLRYTAFVPIYPLGLFAEMACIWLVLPRVEVSGRLSLAMPNPFNVAFHYPTFLRAVLVVQPAAWAFLYTSLLRQRARRLRATAPQHDREAQEHSVAKKMPRDGDEGASGSGEANVIAHVRAWHPSALVRHRLSVGHGSNEKMPSNNI